MLVLHFYRPSARSDDPACSYRNRTATCAVDGLLRLLQRMDSTHAPVHMSVVFDSTQRRLVPRRIVQPRYKSDRAPTPRALVAQFAVAKTVLPTVHVNCIECPGQEADDLVASYSAQYTAAGVNVVLISNDNDFLQLVQGSDQSTIAARVELYQPSKRRYVRERHIRARFGLPPQLLPDLQALCGHHWKKLPRVDNLTDDVAVQLLNQYGGLYPLLRHLDELDDRSLRATMKRCITSIESSYRMVKLVDSVTLPVAIEDLHQPQLN